jgi:uncharacterized membrane protein HdeD (DUF308 family)
VNVFVVIGVLLIAVGLFELFEPASFTGWLEAKANSKWGRRLRLVPPSRWGDKYRRIGSVQGVLALVVGITALVRGFTQ